MNRACFLSMDSDTQLGIITVDDFSMHHTPLKEFFSESLIDLSTEMKRKYAIAFRKFLNDLEK